MLQFIQLETENFTNITINLDDVSRFEEQENQQVEVTFKNGNVIIVNDAVTEINARLYKEIKSINII